MKITLADGTKAGLSAPEVVGYLISCSYEKPLKEFLEEVHFDHRTNQQTLAGVVFSLIKQWSNDFDNNNFDDRNQATVTLSAKIVKALGDDFPVGRLPLI
jgi:hypothetical protein